jgi:YesN/AraC family two-component response regulator
MYVDQHIKEMKSIHTVADRLKIHYDTLRKSFLKNEQIALAEYITMKKVQAMKELLVTGDDPCFYICYEYGYREDSGAKVFKKLTGMTMLEYRKTHMLA